MYRGIGGALRVSRGPITAETDGELSLNVGDIVRICQDPLCHEAQSSGYTADWREHQVAIVLAVAAVLLRGGVGFAPLCLPGFVGKV